MGCRTSSPFNVLAVALAILLVSMASLTLAGSNAPAGVTDLAGNPADPFQSAQGKAVVLVFVRTDCPISNRYAPEIQRLSSAHKDKAEFFLVYVDKRETPDTIRKHAREYNYQLSALRDLQHSLVKRSLAKITPEAAVFDSSRLLIYHGRIDNLYEDFGHARKVASTHELADAIDAAIAGKPPAAASMPAVGCYISDLE